MRSFPNENQVVYVIVLNYNGWWDTIECLESVLKSDYPNFKIIVLDNDSPISQWLACRHGREVDSAFL